MTSHEPKSIDGRPDVPRQAEERADTSTTITRRDFVRTSGLAGLGAGVLGPGILGAPAILRGRNLNASLSVAVMGVNSRGAALSESFARATAMPMNHLPGLRPLSPSFASSSSIDATTHSPGHSSPGKGCGPRSQCAPRDTLIAKLNTTIANR